MSTQFDQNLEKVEAKGNTLVDRIFRDSQGNIVIAQPPNLPILLALSATILEFLVPDGKLAIAFDLVAFGAWFTWSWLEIFQGVNYFRRGLGLLVLVGLFAFKLSLI